jgi:Lar family restriction alleviation protein
MSEKQSEEIKLLPCPFCGGGDVGIHESEHKAHFVAHVCKNEELSVWIKYVSVSTEGHPTREEAIKDWNRRAESAELDRLRRQNAELIKALTKISQSYCQKNDAMDCFEEIEFIKANQGTYNKETERRILAGDDLCPICRAKRAIEGESK